MATVRIGFAEESFKLCVGHDIFQNDGVAYGRKTWNGVAANGLSEAFQLVIRTEEEAILTLDDNPVFHRKGMRPVYRIAVTSALPTALQHIGMVTGDDCLRYGDILLNQPSCELEADVPSAVYVRTEIPCGTPAGTYDGSVRLYRSYGFAVEQLVEELSFSVEVFACTVPPAQQRRFHLDLWQHPANIARRAEVPLWSDRHFTLMEPYLRALADLGQRAITAVVSEIPWCGQAGFMEHRYTTDLYEYSMVRVCHRADGSLSFDFSVLDRYIRTCFRCGFPTNSEIEVFGLINIWRFDDYGYGGPVEDYPEAIRIRVHETDGRYGYLSTATEIDAYVRALRDFFCAAGWLEQVRVVADEPADVDRFRGSLEHMMQIAPGFRYKAAINHAEFIEAFREQIDDFVPIYDCLVSQWGPLQELRAAMPGKRFLWYVCCIPDFPNFFIASALLEGRGVGALTYATGLDGFLRWNFTVWNRDPRQDLRYPRFPCGDMNFVYPAGDMTPLLSLRYRMLQRGLEDYELLTMLADRGQRALADELVAQLVKKRSGEQAASAEELLNLDYAAYASVRRQLLETLSF